MNVVDVATCRCGRVERIGCRVPRGGCTHREENSLLSQRCVREAVGEGVVPLSVLMDLAAEHGCEVRRARDCHLEQYQLDALPDGQAWAMVSGNRQGYGQYTPVAVLLDGPTLEL